MSRFKEFFGKKTSAPPASAATPVAPPTRTVEELRNDPNYIRVFDSYGRELFVTKEQWRTGSLPGTLKAHWNDPDKLYSILASAMHDGFFEDVVDAAGHLFRTDQNAARGATVYAIVLMKLGKLDEAERVTRSYLKTYGDNGEVLTNLAKVQASRNEMREAEETLWRALVVDPNMDNAFAWHLGIHRDRDGEAAVVRELHRIAALPGSWRAQLWLARGALDSKELEKALAFYREALSHAGRPSPTDLLFQMSGDLGKHGHLAEIVQLAESEYIPKLHGLLVGNNLIKAHLELAQIEAAAKILEQLFSLQRPDWKDQLSFWDTTLAKARIAKNNPRLTTPIVVTMLGIDGPVWLKPSSPANSLFPSESRNELLVCFLGGSATIPRASQQIEVQLTDAPGRMSRALPLFLAEQIHFHSGSSVQTLIPWISGNRGGFMLSGTMWSDADAAKYAKMAQPKAELVVVTHLSAESASPSVPWNLQLRLIQTADAQCIATLDEVISISNPEDRLVALSSRLVELLTKHTKAANSKPPAPYQSPHGAWFSDYLLRIEQLLATRCAGIKHDGPDFLSGKREILDGMLRLCLACPTNIVVRILLAETLAAMRRIQPDVEAEFRERVQRLQKQSRLAEPAHSVVEWILGNGAQTEQ